MKKILLLAMVVLFGFASHAFAQEFVPLANIPGLTDIQPSANGLAEFFNNLYRYLIGLAAVLAIIEIVWGGLEISTKDSISKQTDGKERIQEALLGLVLVLSPVLVFSIINPSILNLSVNLPPLDTKSGGHVISGGDGTDIPGTQVTTTDANGCVVRSGQYLETAVCPNQASVSSYSCRNGLIPTAGNCTADQSGKCVSDAKVYCGKSVNVIHYKATHLLGIIAGIDIAVIPRDAKIQNAFVAACNADGGKVDINGKILFSASSCPNDSGITYNTADQSGVTCYEKTLSCVP